MAAVISSDSHLLRLLPSAPTSFQRRWHAASSPIRSPASSLGKSFPRKTFCFQSTSLFLYYPLSLNRRHSEGWSSKAELPFLLRKRRDTIHVVTSEAAESARADALKGDIPFTCQAQLCEDLRTQSISVDSAVQIPFELNSVQQDSGMTFLVLFGAFVWVRLFDFLTSKNILEQKLSRKVVHISSGLLYMFSWPLFSSSKWAPFIAGVVPLANAIRLLVYGLGLMKDEGLVKSVSRSGESRELLRGPLYYVLVLYISTVLFWRESPVGIIALGLMCGGDGIADIVGRKFGSTKLPYNKDKSFAGTIAMFLFGFLVSFGSIYYFTVFGFFKLDLNDAVIRLAFISLAAAIVESLPVTTQLDDNFTVPVTVFILGMLLFDGS